MLKRKENLQRLLKPRTIAVVGGGVAGEMIRQCRKLGFDGELWPVNPHRGEIEGIPCFASIDALPGAPDATFIAVSREQTLEIVSALARRGAGGAVCYASGFAESGADGKALQDLLVQSAGDMALVGPNCYGMVNYLDGCALWPDRQGGQRVARGVALVTQSGNIGLNITMQRRSLPIACMIAVGNKAGTGLHEYIDALLDDQRITAIGLHIEGLDDIPAFSRAAARALRAGVPIVALKMGSSAIGAQLTASHTSSLAGPDKLYEALFARMGIARVADVPALIETLKLLHACGPLQGRDVLAMMCSGGDASMIADLGQLAQVRFPALDDATRSGLAEVLGPRVALANPLDYQTYIWGDEPMLAACFKAMLQARAHCALLVLDYPHPDGVAIEGWDEVVNAYIRAVQDFPVPAMVVSTLPELMPPEVAQRLLAAGIAPMQGMREALGAIAAAAGIGRRAQVAHHVQAVAPIRGQVARVMRNLDEATAKAALAAYGLPVPAGRVVGTAQEACAAAERLGYPVVLKAVGADMLHKTEMGGVKLGLADGNAVQAALAQLAPLSDRFLVERMAQDVLAELVVGVTRDPQFGLSLTIGAGGVLVELLRDSVTLLLPASAADIRAALRSLKCFPLLDGYRGRKKADLEALVGAIGSVVAYAQEQGEALQELEVNPLLAMAEGAVAVDALLRQAAA